MFCFVWLVIRKAHCSLCAICKTIIKIEIFQLSRFLRWFYYMLNSRCPSMSLLLFWIFCDILLQFIIIIVVDGQLDAGRCFCFLRSLVHCRSKHSNNSATYFHCVHFSFQKPKKGTLHCPFVSSHCFSMRCQSFLQKRKGQHTGKN